MFTEMHLIQGEQDASYPFKMAFLQFKSAKCYGKTILSFFLRGLFKMWKQTQNFCTNYEISLLKSIIWKQIFVVVIFEWVGGIDAVGYGTEQVQKKHQQMSKVI